MLGPIFVDMRLHVQIERKKEREVRRARRHRLDLTMDSPVTAFLRPRSALFDKRRFYIGNCLEPLKYTYIYQPITHTGAPNQPLY